jgi:hypothetical protein
MRGFLDDQTVEIPCPGCGEKAAKTIGWLKNHSHYSCGCGANITLESEQFRSGLAEAERSFTELERTIKSSFDKLK